MAEANVSAVLTGDLIGSRQHETSCIDDAMATLSRAAHAFGTAWGLELRFTRFRGDGWQVHVRTAGLVLDATIFLAASLRGAGHDIDTRISAGIGPVETLGTADLSDASGSAFFVSGDRLDRIGKRRFIVAGTGIGDWQAAVFDLAAWHVDGWTAAQAEAVALALIDTGTQEHIARQLGVTRQAVQDRLAKAGFSALDTALHAFRTHDYGGPA